MYAGEIVEDAPARELFEYPMHPYTVGLMNSFPSISGEKRKLTGIPGSPPDLVAPAIRLPFPSTLFQSHADLFTNCPAVQGYFLHPLSRLSPVRSNPVRPIMNLINPEFSPILDIRSITKHFPVGVFYRPGRSTPWRCLLFRWNVARW